MQERADVFGQPRSLVEAEHLNRYVWAAGQVSGRILDVACGTGYGSALLAQRGVLSGLDKDAEAIALARRRVPDADFRECLLPSIPYPAGTFDAVVTFETVEHIDEDTTYASEVARVLKPGGLLLLSTPNAEVSSPGGSLSNPWHVREYTLDELRALLVEFAHIEVFMQGPVRQNIGARIVLRATARIPHHSRPRWCDRLAYGDGRVEPWDGVAPWYWVLRARKSR